jgi:hypothetical protein
MTAINSLSSLSAATLAVLNTVATVAIMYAVGEGGRFQGAAGYYVYCLAIIALGASFVAFVLRATFTPEKLTGNVIKAVRYLLMIYSGSLLILVLGVSGIIAFLGMASFGSDNLVFSLFAISCVFAIRVGAWVMCLTVLIGGVVGIVVELLSLVGRTNYRESKARG